MARNAIESEFWTSKMVDRSEMARNAIESYFRCCRQIKKNAIFLKIFAKNKFRIDLKWPEMRSKVNFGHTKWPIDLKWPEMRSKAGDHIVKNFTHKIKSSVSI